jgi:hypothetical protein
VNSVTLAGSVVEVAEKTVGQQGRSLVELKLAVIRPGRRADESDTIPVTIWNREAAGAALTLAPGSAGTRMAHARSVASRGSRVEEAPSLIGRNAS